MDNGCSTILYWRISVNHFINNKNQNTFHVAVFFSPFYLLHNYHKIIISSVWIEIIEMVLNQLSCLFFSKWTYNDNKNKISFINWNKCVESIFLSSKIGAVVSNYNRSQKLTKNQNCWYRFSRKIYVSDHDCEHIYL